MYNHKEGNHAFTLIEMLVVIAIISIISGVTLVALSPSKNKAKDERIKTDIERARGIAETLYNLNSQEPYADVSVSKNNELKNVSDDIGAQNSQLVIMLASPALSYALYAELSDGTYYCADSKGRTKTLSSSPSGPECQ